MKSITSVICAVFPLFLVGQFNINFFNVDSSQCINDASVTTYQYKNWEIYQTENDLWDGEKIETLCISLGKKFNPNQGTYRYGLDVATIIQDRPVYMRYQMENLSEPVRLVPNQLFVVDAFINNALSFPLNTSSDCEDGMCSGVITILRIEEDGEEAFRRSDFPFFDVNDCLISECFVTEKTEINEVTEMVFKISFGPDPATDELMFVYGVDLIEDWDMPNLINDDIIVPEANNNGTSYDINIYEINQSGWAEKWLVMHNEPGLPSIDNQSITYLTPEINSPEPQTINLIVEEYTQLYFQMFSQLKGGLLENSDSTHHTLNIIYPMANMCVFIVERIFEENTNLVVNGGQIHFPNPSSCLQFRNSGKLIIGKGHTLILGDQGNGILNLRSGGTVVFEEGAHLEINGKLMLNRYQDYHGEQDIYIDLPFGSSLGFGPEAQISNEHTPTKMYIRMLGGQIYLDNLSADDRSKIELVYPTEEMLTSQLTIKPNPATDLVNLSTLRNETIRAYKIVDSNGNTVRENNTLKQESAILSLETSDLISGVYLIAVETISGIYYDRLVVMH